MQPEQDWLPISIPQTYLIVTASSEEEADGVALITPLLLGDFPHPWTFSLMLLDIAEARENPDHPGRASAHTGSAISPGEFPKAPPGSCNKPYRPFEPWWAGSRLSQEVTVQQAKQAPSHDSGSLTVSTSPPQLRFSRSLPKYYMSHEVGKPYTHPVGSSLLYLIARLLLPRCASRGQIRV